MDWMMEEEMAAEWNARFDYQAELRAEHWDPEWDTAPEEDATPVELDDDGDIPF